jgi:hypothetical protein
MKTTSKSEQGSVLITAFLTITIVLLLATTSLYIAGENQTTGSQAASWQQALTAAESGIDKAVAALNNTNTDPNAWTGWYKVAQVGTSLPSAETGISMSTAATGTPPPQYYNYLPSTQFGLTTTGEGATSSAAWVTVDTAGMSASQDTNGKQWFRVRSTGRVSVSGPRRSTMNRLDADLRNSVSVLVNRKGDATLGASRTIEVVMAPIPGGTWSRGITSATGIQMSGSGTIDSFDSSKIPSPHQWSLTYRQSHGDVGIVNNTTNSDLRSTYVYGNLSYSNSVVKNTTNVQGTITTPGPPTLSAAPTPPTGVTWQAYAGGGGTMTAGTASNQPTYYKVSGDLTISGGNSLILQNANASANNPIVIWVTGKLTTSGTGFITQGSNVYATWYVGNDITCSGSSYLNNSGYAAQVTINGIGSNNKATVSGSAVFTGTINAPTYDTTISGGGDFAGALITNTLTISGGSSFHFDESVKGASSTLGNYSFASWFEDNSDSARGVSY